MSIFIEDWKALNEMPVKESATHALEVDVDMGCGWLKAKKRKEYNPNLSYMRQIRNLDVYLSTHTFYGSQYKQSQKILRVCGFDVELNNWDKEGR
jgi:hypothetical protein